ncbi:MAG TPA: TonB-dependent receptor [Ramlibacter sp.]|uniref:TonB-dependent receptor n=1 Tax=Ramlibacter sp. TaxID=1917967 RepID=UPI002C9AD4FD|nr:TonB-dependent receptor [Ramlibacter sp.]HVZ46030.1 TonB-dependent receptor [Ramlibacter sp.]
MFVAQETLAQSGASLQRVEITGSNIPRTETETPSPVQVITAEQLKNSGYTTVSEVLREITANGNGTLTQGFNQAFSGGASGVSLRGLTLGATLVLIDGHRMAPYPLSDDGERQFVDISSIPFAAVERIEILKDGASAVYGSDAIAGVVNVILKKSFEGTLVSADAGMTEKGGGTTKSFALTHGFGKSSDNVNGYVALEYRKQDEIRFSQRSGDWTSLNWTALGGEDLRPGATNVYTQTPRVLTPILQRPGSASSNAANFAFLDSRCNYASWRAGGCVWQDNFNQIIPNTENINVLGSLTARLNQDWDLNVKASMFESKSQQVRFGATIPFGSFAGSTITGPGIVPVIVGAIPTFTVPATYPGNTLGVPANVRGYLPDTGYQRREDIDSKSYRLVADLSGTIGAWDTKASAGWTRVDTKVTYSGYINPGNLYAALNDPINPFLLTGGNSAAMMNFVAPTVSNTSSDTLSFIELRGSREVMKLPGGPLGIAIGASAIHKKLYAPDPIGSQTGLQPTNGAYALGSDTNIAFYAEAVAPVTKMLELDAAVRHDHFSTFGNSTTPKAGFKLTPMPELGIRGTVAKGFRAPAPTENGTAGALYSFNQITDPVLCPNPGTPTSPSNVPAYCGFSPTYLQGTNANLQPEKSTSYTLGVILEPVKNWSTTLDFYKITIKNQIVSGGLIAGFDPLPYAVRGTPQVVTFGDGSTGLSSVGPIQFIPVPYLNGQSTTTSGIELDTRYKFNLHEYGALTAGLTWTHIFNFNQTLNGATFSLAGTHGPSGVGGDTASPRNRAQLILTYERGPLSVTSTTNYVGSYDVTDPSAGYGDCISGITGITALWASVNPPSNFCRVKAFTYMDLTARYKVNDKLSIRAGITNVFDAKPPVDMATYGGTGRNDNSVGSSAPYNAALHLPGAIGRGLSVGLDYRF